MRPTALWQFPPDALHRWARYDDEYGTGLKRPILSKPGPGVRLKLGVARMISGTLMREAVAEFVNDLPLPIAVSLIVYFLPPTSPENVRPAVVTVTASLQAPPAALHCWARYVDACGTARNRLSASEFAPGLSVNIGVASLFGFGGLAANTVALVSPMVTPMRATIIRAMRATYRAGDEFAGLLAIWFSNWAM